MSIKKIRHVWHSYLSQQQWVTYLHDPIWPNASSADSLSSVSGLADDSSNLSMADIAVLTPEFRRKLSTIRNYFRIILHIVIYFLKVINPKQTLPLILYTLMEQSICLISKKSPKGAILLNISYTMSTKRSICMQCKLTMILNRCTWYPKFKILWNLFISIRYLQTKYPNLFLMNNNLLKEKGSYMKSIQERQPP